MSTPLRCSLTILPIAHIFADLFTQAALWLPLACCTSFLGPHNALACSAARRFAFVRLLASTASRCSLLVDEHRPLTTKRTLSNLQFDSFFSISILRLTVELLHRFARSRRRRNILSVSHKPQNRSGSVFLLVCFKPQLDHLRFPRVRVRVHRSKPFARCRRLSLFHSSLATRSTLRFTRYASLLSPVATATFSLLVSFRRETRRSRTLSLLILSSARRSARTSRCVSSVDKSLPPPPGV